jgi:hypothetical protein
MNLVDEYLRAVSILLPKAQRDDIIAELRDTILSRIEAREAELGRPLTDDETEAVLREVGHPLVVAARYREGPQHVVGPTVYPYWMFAVKVGVAVQVLIAVVVAFARVITGDDFGFAVGHAVSSVVSGGLVLVGLATVVAWIVERQGFHIGYLDHWHVRELGFLEFAAWDLDTLRDGLAGRGWSRWPRWPGGPSPSGKAEPRVRPSPPPHANPYMPPPPRWSPSGHGLALIAVGAVLIMWWVGLTRFDLDLSAGSLQAQGLDLGRLATVDWEAFRATLFWPVLAFGVWTILRGTVHVAHPWAVRLQGLMDAVSGAAVVAFGAWLWTRSPLSPAIRVDSLAEFFDRLRPLDGHAAPVGPILTVVVAVVILTGVGGVLRGLWELIFGPPPSPWALGI